MGRRKNDKLITALAVLGLVLHVMFYGLNAYQIVEIRRARLEFQRVVSALQGIVMHLEAQQSVCQDTEPATQ